MPSIEPRLSIHLATSSWLWSDDWPWRLGELLGAISPGLAPRGVHVRSRLRRWTPQNVAATYRQVIAVIELVAPDTHLSVWARIDEDQWHGLVTITGPLAAARETGLLHATWALALAGCADYAHVHVLTEVDLEAAPPGTISQLAGLSVTGGDDLGEKGLPYLWWGTLLGASWAALIGEDVLEKTPAAAVERIAPDMWWIQLTDDLLDTVHQPDAVEAARQRVLDHLGRDLFGTREAPAARIPDLPVPPDDPEPEAPDWDDVYVNVRRERAAWVDAREQVLQRLMAGTPRTPLTLGRRPEREPAGSLAKVGPAPSGDPEAVEALLSTVESVEPAVVDRLLADLAAAAPKLAGRTVEVDSAPMSLNAQSLWRALADGGARIDCGAAEVTVDCPDEEEELDHAIVGMRAGLGAEDSFAALPEVVRRWAARLRPFFGQLVVEPPGAGIPEDDDEDDEDDELTPVDELAAGLPDPAWGTVLGQAYVDLIGADALRSAPVAVAEELAPGVFWLQLTADIRDPVIRPDAVAAARRALRRHLGERLFRGSSRPKVPRRAALLRRPEERID